MSGALRRSVAGAVLMVGALGAWPARAADPPPMPWLAPSAERTPSCGDVTLEQCSDPVFMYETACGEEQRSRPDSECAALLFEGLEAAREARGEELSIVPRALHASGVEYVTRASRADEQREYTPNMFSLHSQRAAAGYTAPGGRQGVDEHDAWAADGPVVSSCREYAWEKFADINEFHYAANGHWDDGRAMFEIAFGPGDDPAAIGTRHLIDPVLRGRDGRPVGEYFHGFWRRHITQLQAYPHEDTEFPPPDVPSLFQSMLHRWPNAYQVIVEARANDWLMDLDWSDMYERSELLSVDHDAEGDDQLSPGDLLGVPQSPGAFSLDELGFSAGGDAPVRRRLDAELDELQRLMDRMAELQLMWVAANNRWRSSGWNVVDAGIAQPYFLVLPPAPPQDEAPAGQTPGALGAPPSPGLGPQNIGTEDPETVARRYILDELAEIILTFEEEGCVVDGVGPCDWSPSWFARRMNNDFGPRQDAAYDFCNEWSGGDVRNLQNLNVVFVDDPEYPEFYCSVVTGPQVTAANVDYVAQMVPYCRQRVRDYNAQRALDEARDRVREVPELVDPASGDFVPPGVENSAFESMGNEYFGMSYSWGYGFAAGIDADICQLQFQAGGHMRARAFVVGQPVVLLDFLADADTIARTVDLHFRVLSKNVLVPRRLIDPEVHISVPQADPLEFNISTSFESSKRQRVLDFTVVVVVVPVSIAAGLAGRVGTGLGLDVYAEPADNDGCPSVDVGGSLTPYVGIDGFVEAAIDIYVAAVGIRGSLNILTAGLNFAPSVGVQVLRLTTNPEDYEMHVGIELDAELSTLSGSLQLFGELGPCPFCLTGELELIKWAGPTWTENLLSQEYSVNLADLFAAFP